MQRYKIILWSIKIRNNMKQKVWLITGVSKGLGREIAKQVIAEGDIVIGTVRNEEDKVAFEKGVDAKAFIIDLIETKHIPALISSIIKDHGRIDVLVNNAGFGAFGMIEEFDEEEVTNQFNVNVIAVWKLCQAVLPYMRDNGSGTIVQISSRAGITAGVGNGIYASSKFALVELQLNLGDFFTLLFFLFLAAFSPSV